MTDVVVTLPVMAGEESLMFGRFLNRFMESRSLEAEKMAAFSDAPFMMVRSDPLEGREIKVLTFQESSVASAFSSGWARLRTRGSQALRG